MAGEEVEATVEESGNSGKSGIRMLVKKFKKII